MHLNLDRLNGPRRLAGVDLARGLAVLGMLAAHLLWTGEVAEWDEPSTWTAIVNGRSSILFATLAGVSIGILTGGRGPLSPERMSAAWARIAIRAGILLAIGILLIVTGVPVYVILPAYAILFVLVLPFTTMSARALLFTAAGIGILMPFLQPVLNELPFWASNLGGDVALAIGWNYPFTLWIAFVLAGLGAARADLRVKRVQIRMLVTGAVVSGAGYALAFLPAPGEGPYWDAVWTAAPHSSGVWEAVGSGGFAIAVIGACQVLCRVPAVKLITLPLRATGAMPLTAYSAQLVAWAIIAAIAFGDTSDLGGFRELEPFWPFVGVTLLGATVWAVLIGRGPLEWVLDRSTRSVGGSASRR
ncbi:heparan-alpha-glucosaminide N-acetyltransferase domain-containing protein [Microbacterium sp. A588]